MTTKVSHAPTDTTTLPRRGARLTSWAGYSMITIAVLHTAVFLFHPHWSAWLSGELRDNTANEASVSLFWALPGGFVPVLALLGLLVAGLGRRGQPVPGYFGPVLIAWAAFCVFLIGPSGFLTAIVPAALLIAADIITRRASAASPA